MAVMLGMRVTLIDPRTAFASPERFPDIEMTHQYPDEALVGMQIGARTYIVVLTHDPKFDDPAVMAGLRGQAAYVGVLGSRRVQQQRLERLRKLGLSEQELAQMHSPIGLPIGAQTPEEIAVAIMAQMIEVKNVEAAR
jgi:xanthine dehydrogenase accessory factor